MTLHSGLLSLPEDKILAERTFEGLRDTHALLSDALETPTSQVDALQKNLLAARDNRPAPPTQNHTYIKRYQLAALLNITATDEADDDGAAARYAADEHVPHTPAQAPPLPPRSEPDSKPMNPRTGGAISEKQLARLYARAKATKWTEAQVIEEVRTRFNYANPADINWKEYQRIVQHFDDTPAPVPDNDVPF